MDEQLNRAPCGYLVMDDHFQILEVNETFVELMKRERFEIVGANFQQFLTVPSRVYFQTYFEPVMTIQGRVSELYTSLKASGVTVPVLLNAVKVEDRYECVILQMNVRDEYENEMITARKNAERVLQDTDQAYSNLLEVMNEYEQRKQELIKINAELNELSITDNLTNLKNRRFFEDRLSFLMDLSESEGVPFSLCMIDVDNFKVFNDTFGHLSGDFVLKEIAKIMQNTTRNDDLVSRYGGEEFMILLPSMGADMATDVVERIRSAVETHQWIDQPVTISCGLTEYTTGDTIESIIARADEGLYESKNSGRNQVTLKMKAVE